MKPDGNFQTDTEVEGTYFDTGLFKPGLTYHFTTIKAGSTLFFQVEGDGQNHLFEWDVSDFPLIIEGRVGLRQMQTRQSRYRDFRIWVRA